MFIQTSGEGGLFLTFCPILNHDTIESSYMFYVFRNHYHILGYSCRSYNNIRILD